MNFDWAFINGEFTRDLRLVKHEFSEIEHIEMVCK